MRGYARWRRRKILANSTISDYIWREVEMRVPLLRRFSVQERTRLRELAAIFMHDKTFDGAGGLAVTEGMRLSIALQACVPILNLGLKWYRGWVSIIVYPGGFAPGHSYVDEVGVVHTSTEPLTGESWLSGPVVLSWPDVEAQWPAGYNLVIHELAHKLDMLNGAANGMPPLHRNMAIKDWTRDFTRAYEDLQAKLARSGTEIPIDPYAAEAPAEFFAVLSELFFESPKVVREIYPLVYRRLRDFYRQDPAARTAPDS
jgi:Mlc titration factor MtfA (ptsG expression regulator)